MEATTVLIQEARLSTACSDPGNIPACSDPGNIQYRGERVDNIATGLENCLRNCMLTILYKLIMQSPLYAGMM